MRKINLLTLAALAGLAAMPILIDDSSATTYTKKVPEGFDFKLIDQSVQSVQTSSTDKTRYSLTFENNGTSRLTIEPDGYGYYSYIQYPSFCSPFSPTPSSDCTYWCNAEPTITIPPGDSKTIRMCYEGGPLDHTDLFTASFRENSVTKKTVEFAVVVDDHTSTCSKYAAETPKVIACLREGDSIRKPYPPPPPSLTNAVYRAFFNDIVLEFDKPVFLSEDWYDDVMLTVTNNNGTQNEIQLDDSSRLLLDNGTLIWIDLPYSSSVLIDDVSSIRLHVDSVINIYNGKLLDKHLTTTVSSQHSLWKYSKGLTIIPDYTSKYNTQTLNKICSSQLQLNTNAALFLNPNDIVLSFDKQVTLLEQWNERMSIEIIYENGTNHTIDSLDGAKSEITDRNSLVWLELKWNDWKLLRNASILNLHIEPNTINIDSKSIPDSVLHCGFNQQLTIPLTIIP